MDALLGEIAPIIQGGATALLLAVVWFIIRVLVRGDFVPKQTVDALLAGRDAEIERAIRRGDEYRDAAEIDRHALEVVRAQNTELIEVARTVQHVMEALKEVAERPPDVGTRA